MEGEDSLTASLITPSKRQSNSSPVRTEKKKENSSTDSILMWSLEKEWKKLAEQNETIEFETEGNANNSIIVNDSATSEEMDTPNTKQIKILVKHLENLQSNIQTGG